MRSDSITKYRYIDIPFFYILFVFDIFDIYSLARVVIGYNWGGII